MESLLQEGVDDCHMVYTMSNVISPRKKSLQFSMKMAISIKIPFSHRDRKINMFIKTTSFPMKNALKMSRGLILLAGGGLILLARGVKQD